MPTNCVLGTVFEAVAKVQVPDQVDAQWVKTFAEQARSLKLGKGGSWQLEAVL